MTTVGTSTGARGEVHHVALHFEHGLAAVIGPAIAHALEGEAMCADRHAEQGVETGGARQHRHHGRRRKRQRADHARHDQGQHQPADGDNGRNLVAAPLFGKAWAASAGSMPSSASLIPASPICSPMLARPWPRRPSRRPACRHRRVRISDRSFAHAGICCGGGGGAADRPDKPRENPAPFLGRGRDRRLRHGLGIDLGHLSSEIGSWPTGGDARLGRRDRDTGETAHRHIDRWCRWLRRWRRWRRPCTAGAGRGCGGGAVCTAGSGGAVTGIACQTWLHFEQRTLRPSGGNTALVS